MSTIERHRFERSADTTSLMATTHKLAIGFDNRSEKADKAVAGKLLGFAVFHVGIDKDNKKIPDHEIMECIHPGYKPEDLTLAMQRQLDADPGLLPMTVRCKLKSSAAPDADGWDFTGIYASEFAYKTKTMFCSGNGYVAGRRENNGPKRIISCVPAGAILRPGETHCPFSVRRECRANCNLLLQLYVPDENGVHQPVSKSFGHGATFLFHTTSEVVAMQILQELERAASVLNGKIGGLTGQLTFQKRRRETGNERFPTGIVGQIVFTIDPEAIYSRMQHLLEDDIEIRKLRIEERRVLLLPDPTNATPADPDVRPPLAIEPEPENIAEMQPAMPEPEPEPDLIFDADMKRPLKLEEATPEQMVDALFTLTGNNPERLGKYASFQYLNPNNPCLEMVRFIPPTCGWFLEGVTPAKQLYREQALKGVCAALLLDPTNGFVLYSTGDDPEDLPC